MILEANYEDKNLKEERVKHIKKCISEDILSSLFIEPASICNLSCKFCNFQKISPKLKGIMTYDTFNRILNSLEELSFKFYTTHLYLHGEPLLNLGLVWMMHQLKNKKLTERIKIATNGTLLSPYSLLNMIDVVDCIMVSLDEGTPEKFEKTKGRDVFGDVVSYLNEAIDIINERPDKELTIKCTRNDNEYDVIELFRDKVEKSSNIHIEIRNEFKWRRRGLHFCELPLYQLAIFHDGEVSPCCNAFHGEFSVGNIERNTLSEILKSDYYLKIKNELKIRGGIEHPSCFSCGYESILIHEDFK